MGQTYKVSGTLLHGGERFEDGADFTSEDEALLEMLHRERVLLTPEEYAVAAAEEGNGEALQRAAAERAAKDAEIEELKRQLAEAQASKGGKKANADAEQPAE